MQFKKFGKTGGPKVSKVSPGVSKPLGSVDQVRAAPASCGGEPARYKPMKKVTVKRTGGGQEWEDRSLLEWDPSHFRLFVGNLSAEVTDEMLRCAFAPFESLSKVKVVRDKDSKPRGYGFVAFSDPNDYFKAFKQMNGKYVGIHPVQLKRATTDVRPTTLVERRASKRGPAGRGEKRAR